MEDKTSKEITAVTVPLFTPTPMEESFNPLEEETSPPHGAKRARSRFLSILYHFICLLWIVPIVALIALNVTGYVVGASFGCPLGCQITPLEPTTTTRRAMRLDVDDRNALGGLQFAAKALEIWFIAVMVALVYDVTMFYARKDGGGLPMQYLMSPLQFADLRQLFYPSFWTSIYSLDGKEHWISRKKLMLYIYLHLLIFCGIISNIMGPATAVLLLPKSEWVEREVWSAKTFSSFKSNEVPTPDDFDFGCQSLVDNPGDYHCAYPLDKYMDLFLTTTFLDNGRLQHLSEEDNLSFALNNSDTGLLNHTMRAPSRQVLREVRYLRDKYETAAQAPTYQNASDILSAYYPDDPEVSFPNFRLFQNSIQGQIVHLGPSVEYASGCAFNVSEIVVSSDRSVRCYNMPNPDGLNNDTPVHLPYPISDPELDVSTICIRNGSGWGEATDYTHMHVTNSKHGNLSINVYSTEGAIYLDSKKFGCVTGDRVQTESSCNWEAWFNDEIPQEFKGTLMNSHIVEYEIDEVGVTWCQTSAFLRFSNYQYDLSSLTNPLNLVVLDNVGPFIEGQEPLRIHPSWFRAAWSVGLNDEPLTGERDATELIVGETKRLYPTEPITRYHEAIMGQVLSIITHEQDTLSSFPTSPPGAGPTPLLRSFFRSRVWSYNLGSRTSKLGVMVAVTGCFMVLMHSFVALFIAKRVKREPLDLVVAGLLQKPPGGFTANATWNRVRFEMDNELGAEFVLRR
ncbi:hypothetical protein M501DRAFT_1014729 [Patellaria atrata CBS 101060]|uniref:Uncharacterized protein n=1 Tax=Patellaria atrata CBS 101060 TaxID=1346257 RepID=A0A9P4SE17_9PEZI|nr:hypothetical protein M501DRAFT_1014729 [Patellaria atrata CBS 101060]